VPEYVAMTDKELVKRCQNDAGAFEELLERYKRVVFAYARATIGSAPDAEEVTQDVFVKVFRAAHRFDERYSFKTWLYTIVSNTCKNKLRSRRHKTMSLDAEDSPVVGVSNEADPLDAYERELDIAEVRKAIGALPARYREVLYLRYIEGLRYAEIAETLGLSLGNVEARIFRGKEKVRRWLVTRHTKKGPPSGTGEQK
jgi:RNA polymerase sigma-70 factor (ECF subfamily)